MKKIYSIIVAMILAAVSFAASAYSITVNIDHPERINLTTYTSGLSIPDPLTESFVVESSYASLTVYTTESKYFIKSIVDQDGNPLTASWGTYYIYVDSENDGKTFTITTGDKETEPKSKCFVTIDDPAKVKIAFNDVQYTYINDNFEAAPAVNTVEFIEGLQSPLILKAATNEYVTRLRTVKVDGVDVEPNYSNVYNLNVTDGSNVEIVYNFPDEECEVQLILPDGTPASAITRVNVLHESGNQEVEVVDSKVTVPMGRFVDFYMSSDYKFSGYTLNDDPFAEFHGTSSFRVFIDHNSTLSLDLTPYARYEAVFSITNAAAVKLTNYISWDEENVIEVVDGDNNISVSEGSPYLRLYDSPAGYINSVTDDTGKEYSKGNWQDYYDVTLSANGPKKIIIDATLYSTDPVKVTWDDTYAPGLKFNQLVLAVHNVDYPATEVEMDETGFTAMPGNSYYLELNTSEYTFTANYGANNCVYTDKSATESVPVLSYSTPYNFQVFEGGTVTLEAAPNPHYVFTVTIDDPTAATVYHRVYNSATYNYDKFELPLEAGVAKVFDIVSGSYPQILIEPIDNDHYATAREANSDQLLGPGSFSIDNGYDIRITTGVYDRSSQMAVYVKDRALADYGFYIRLADEKTYLRDDEYNGIIFWSEGYNLINFDENGDVPMAFIINGDSYYGTFDTSKVALILDDEVQVSPTPGYLEYQITPKNGSVIKAFVGGEPEKFDVNFTVEGDKNFTVKKDILSEVADLSAPVNVHEGTRVDIIPDEGETIEVTVNDRKWPVLEGQYTFYITAATDVKIQGKQSGIDTIGADAAAADRDVYNLQGIKVLDNATPDQLKALPAGLYIQGGQKIVVK